MIKIMFVCYGNICRSPMAEFLMKDYVKQRGQSDLFYIKSSATSYEEIGNPVHYGTKAVLDGLNIDCRGKISEKLYKNAYGEYDYFIGMDEYNIRDIKSIFGGDKDGKVYRLLDFTDDKRDVADPWYTRNFRATYEDITKGIDAFYGFLKEKHGF